MAEETQSTPVDTTNLKNKFRARSIPLEKDFYDLIDMADAGRLAAGLSPEQSATKDTATTGLIIDKDKRLAVKAKLSGGLSVDVGAVAVKSGKGITVDENGVSFNFSDAMPAGTILMWNNAEKDIPLGWVICDGSNGIPDLKGRFILGGDGLTKDSKNSVTSGINNQTKTILHIHY